MDIVQFLFSVVNLMLALVVLFGGRLIFKRLENLNARVAAIEKRVRGTRNAGSDYSEAEDVSPPLKWK